MKIVTNRERLRQFKIDSGGVDHIVINEKYINEKDKEILSTTKKDIEKKLKVIKKRIKKVNAFKCEISKIINNNLVSNIIENIKDKRMEAAKKLGVSDSSIKMSFYNDGWGDHASIQFYINREETNEEFKRRIATKLNKQWDLIKKKQENIQSTISKNESRFKREQAKRQKNAIDAIKDFDGDIYELFQEINKK